MEKLFSFIILLVAAVLLAPGCIAEETSVVDGVNTTEVIETTNMSVTNETEVVDIVEANVTESIETALNTTYTADINVTGLTMKIDETALITLAENPTTGYMWNVTNSSGLEIVSDIYAIDAAEEGMVGVGGIHEWTVKAIAAGNQTFNAVMTHVADVPTGNEETYTLNVVVEEIAGDSVEEKPTEKIVQ